MVRIFSCAGQLLGSFLWEGGKLAGWGWSSELELLLVDAAGKVSRQLQDADTPPAGAAAEKRHACMSAAGAAVGECGRKGKQAGAGCGHFFCGLCSREAAVCACQGLQLLLVDAAGKVSRQLQDADTLPAGCLSKKRHACLSGAAAAAWWMRQGKVYMQLQGHRRRQHAWVVDILLCEQGGRPEKQQRVS